MDSTDLHFPDQEVILRDGRSLRLRPIRPDDKNRLKDLFYRLSPRSRYLRFHSPKQYITADELAAFTEIDPPDTYACVATVGQGQRELIVAVGRWFILEDRKSAEVAFTVDDTNQARGIGTALVAHLAEAAIEVGFERLEAVVLAENTGMLRVFEHSGFQVTKRYEYGVYICDIDLTKREAFVERQAYREHIARSTGVRHLLNPRRVAVIGASRDPEKVGGAIFRNVLNGDFSGTVFPVNASAPSVGGVLAYPSVLDIPGDIDVAIIAVPARYVLDVVEECARKGIWGLTIVTAGFGETDEAGKQREKELRDKILAHQMRLIGPNCLGIVNTAAELSLNATFAPTLPVPGRVSMGSQSGALGLAILDYAESINLGLSQFVSLGNKVDVSSNDLLEYWEDDPNTDVILLYLESFGNPRKFSRIARRVSRSKPIIAVKGGRSSAGAQAASSHTGALAGADVAVDALFRQAGVIRVSGIEEMFDAAQVLAYQPPPKGSRVAIVTNAGGPGILAADACESSGLDVLPLSDSTRRELESFLPPEASVRNPVDMIASATPEQYQRALSCVLQDPDVDAVILIYIPLLSGRPEAIADAICAAVEAGPDAKPVVACFMKYRGAPSELELSSGAFIPSFVFPEDAARSLAHAYNYTRYREQPEGQIPVFPDVDQTGAREIVEPFIDGDEAGAWLYPEAAMELVRRYGIPVVETRAAASATEAVETAEAIGYPVAMKVRSSTIIHKTDVGGVALGLASASAVTEAFEQIQQSLESAGRGDEADGVVLQPMAAGGQEVIIGMTEDATFGPLVMVGVGGTQVEITGDVAFSLHPLTDLDPDRMLRQLKSLPILTGWRGSKPRDVEALKELLLRFSALIEDLPEIDQIEINPVRVFDQGMGCLAVDARVLVRKPQPYVRW